MLRAPLLSFILLIGIGMGSVRGQFLGEEIRDVGTVEELLAAIAPNRTIRLKPGTIRFSNDSLKKHKHVGRLGYAVFVHEVKNLRIVGAREGASELVSDGLTLTFANCRNIELRDLKLKRTGSAPGAVIRFASSTNSLLRNCEITGGTAAAIELKQADRFELRNVIVRHCRPGILTAESSANLTFDRCRFENNGKEYGMRFQTVYGVVFEDSVIANNDVGGDFFQLVATGKISITGGQLTGNSYQRLNTPGVRIRLQEVGGLDPKPN